MGKPVKPRKAKKRISVTMQEPYLEALDHMIEEGVYFTRGEIILEALRHFFKDHGVELPYHKDF